MNRRLAKKIYRNRNGFRARWKLRHVQKYAKHLIADLRKARGNGDLNATEMFEDARAPEAIQAAWDRADEAFRARWFHPARLRYGRYRDNNPNPSENDKRGRRLRDIVRKGRVELAPQEHSHSADLGPKVQHLLDVIADMAHEPGMAQALVTDLSALSDFRPGDVPIADWCAEFSRRIGVEVVPGETILIDIARRLAVETP